MYFRQISGDGEHFGFPFGFTYTLAFSRILYPNEILVAYNVEDSDRHDSVIVDAVLHADGYAILVRGYGYDSGSHSKRRLTLREAGPDTAPVRHLGISSTSHPSAGRVIQQ